MKKIKVLNIVIIFIVIGFLSGCTTETSDSDDDTTNGDGAVTAPNLAWTIDDSEDTMTITSGSASNKYADSSTNANLIFKSGTTYYYVKADLSLGTTETGLSTNTIQAGDVISGFSIAGDWQIIWVPTDRLLGTITFSSPPAPNLAWTIDDAQNIMTITSGSASSKYAESSTNGNLIFRKGTTYYYLKDDLSLGASETGLSTNQILAGDTITGFTDGTYMIVWEPTNRLLGEITFT